ncbi:MAG: phytanoyl-CoA dioxygenase family protein [Halioglobus sp.]|nr:phytanoyl-CoA dioxygenase family protein [Halioglobus sp.]
MSDSGSYLLSETQQRYFSTFGFLVLRGLLADRVPEITEAFDRVMSDPDNEGIPLDYAQGDRIMLPSILDYHAALASLKEDQRITAIPDSLIGSDWEWADSSGDVLDCETTWHRDVYHSPLTQLHIKLLLYLDPLTADTGALRVMPGTNYFGDPYVNDVLKGQGFPDRMHEVFGVQSSELPCTPVETDPGDVIVLNFRTVHASFAGKGKRRLINLNYREPA